jgi:hypothetical protein
MTGSLLTQRTTQPGAPQSLGDLGMPDTAPGAVR